MRPITTPYVLCYGSNMSLQRMLARCPSARPVRRLILHGWRLEFRYHADAVRTGDRKDALRCALYRVNEADLQALDRYEGVTGGSYERHAIRVRLRARPHLNEEEQLIMTWIYVMPDRRRDHQLSPGREYLQHIVRGYRDWGFSLKHLKIHKSVYFHGNPWYDITTREDNDDGAHQYDDSVAGNPYPRGRSRGHHWA